MLNQVNFTRWKARLNNWKLHRNKRCTTWKRKVVVWDLNPSTRQQGEATWMHREKRHLPEHHKCKESQEGKRKNRCTEIFGLEKISFLVLAPRNNKLSRVTAYLFLGPKGAAVSYFIIITKPKRCKTWATLRTLYYSFLSTQELMAVDPCWDFRNPSWLHTWTCAPSECIFLSFWKLMQLEKGRWSCAADHMWPLSTKLIGPILWEGLKQG